MTFPSPIQIRYYAFTVESSDKAFIWITTCCVLILNCVDFHLWVLPVCWHMFFLLIIVSEGRVTIHLVLDYHKSPYGHDLCDKTSKYSSVVLKVTSMICRAFVLIPFTRCWSMLSLYYSLIPVFRHLTLTCTQLMFRKKTSISITISSTDLSETKWEVVGKITKKISKYILSEHSKV
jgi:hypothetical protein